MDKANNRYTGDKISDNRLKQVVTYARQRRETHNSNSWGWATPDSILKRRQVRNMSNDPLKNDFYFLSDNKKYLGRADNYKYIEDREASFVGDMQIAITARDDRKEFNDVMAIRGYREQFKRQIIMHATKENKALFTKILMGGDEEMKLLRKNESKSSHLYELNKVNDITKDYNDLSRRLTEIAVEINAVIIIRVNTGVNKVAHRRLEPEEGIKYVTLEVDNDIIYQNVYTIETLYALHEQFGNIRVEGNKMYVIDYNGEYVYDMNIVHETYGREVTVRKDKELKAAALGDELREVTSKDGSLIIYSRPKAETITVGQAGVCILKSSSVWINPNNKRLVLTDDVEYCDRRFIKPRGREVNLREIVVKCEPEIAIEGVTISLRSYSLKEYVTVKFERGLTVEQYQYLVSSGINVETPNKTELQQDVLNDL